MLPNRAQDTFAPAAPPPAPVRPRHSSSGLSVPAQRARTVTPSLHAVPARPAAPPAAGRSPWRGLGAALHLHRYTWRSEDPFSGHNLYACRCGRVRHGL